jgi:hypothetical protein
MAASAAIEVVAVLNSDIAPETGTFLPSQKCIVSLLPDLKSAVDFL